MTTPNQTEDIAAIAAGTIRDWDRAVAAHAPSCVLFEIGNGLRNFTSDYLRNHLNKTDPDAGRSNHE